MFPVKTLIVSALLSTLVLVAESSFEGKSFILHFLCKCDVCYYSGFFFGGGGVNNKKAY